MNLKAPPELRRLVGSESGHEAQEPDVDGSQPVWAPREGLIPCSPEDVTLNRLALN